jgi:cytoskeletal protein RodZ
MTKQRSTSGENEHDVSGWSYARAGAAALWLICAGCSGGTEQTSGFTASVGPATSATQGFTTSSTSEGATTEGSTSTTDDGTTRPPETDSDPSAPTSDDATTVAGPVCGDNAVEGDEGVRRRGERRPLWWL